MDMYGMAIHVRIDVSHFDKRLKYHWGHMDGLWQQMAYTLLKYGRGVTSSIWYDGMSPTWSITPTEWWPFCVSDNGDQINHIQTIPWNVHTPSVLWGSWSIDFIHILQDHFTAIGAILRLPRCQWNNPRDVGKLTTHMQLKLII